MSKYNARKTEVDGYIFDSKKESNRYCELRLLEKADEITELELQPKFPLVVNGEKIATYIADFRYNDHGKVVVEDTKGFRTREYRIKKKLVHALYGIEIVET